MAKHPSASLQQQSPFRGSRGLARKGPMIGIRKFAEGRLSGNGRGGLAGIGPAGGEATLQRLVAHTHSFLQRGAVLRYLRPRPARLSCSPYHLTECSRVRRLGGHALRTGRHGEVTPVGTADLVWATPSPGAPITAPARWHERKTCGTAKAVGNEGTFAVALVPGEQRSYYADPHPLTERKRKTEKQDKGGNRQEGAARGLEGGTNMRNRDACAEQRGKPTGDGDDGAVLFAIPTAVGVGEGFWPQEGRAAGDKASGPTLRRAAVLDGQRYHNHSNSNTLGWEGLRFAGF
ncbi:hypothetical protein VTK73DRAFT_2450 [Phialemonium thermophilum]|uniref:Uncharacterized protein n=1 Tax=Phialemonium thermophilum TaxID=223376 RepID=A0ABR3VS41_9PEZI